MSQTTERIGLVTTVSATFYTPFHAARMLASLDHISGGRAGWNVVTSMFDAEAQNHGMAAIPDHATRYARAEEFIDVALRLFDSWPADSIVVERGIGDRETPGRGGPDHNGSERPKPSAGPGRYMDAGRLNELNHAGRNFSVRGPLNVPSPPQGRPVLFQAGASEQGRDLAARRAEAIYAVAYDVQSGRDFRMDVRRRIGRAGYNPDSVAILPGLVTYVGATMEEALAKQAALDELLPVKSSLRQLSLFTQQDATVWNLDGPVPELPPLEEFTGPKGRYATILRIIETEQPTVRQLLGRLAAGGGHCTMVGTAESIADEIEYWLDTGAADGFNLMPPSLPHGIEEFIDHVVPELQRRGRFRTEYEGTTLREHMGLSARRRRRGDQPGS